MADAYRKVGRGGAGNFYSKQDIEQAAKSTSPSDLEAQKPAPPADEPPSDPAQPPAPGPPSSSTPAYARTGRGGAGNYVDSSTAAAASAGISSQAQARPATVHTTGNQSFAQPTTGSGNTTAGGPVFSTSTERPPRTGGGLTGRGGAGNWTADESQRVFDEEQDRKRREALDAKVFDDVRAGLQEPGRAHTRVHPHRGVPGKGAGQGGFEDI
ncbi:hypothetical protein JX266_000717 [Neoarthrinium moseri]|nr:hypothetical protein JX266_000717 [Neoarthrinium moseri]